MDTKAFYKSRKLAYALGTFLAALVVALLASLLALLGGAIHPALGALLTMLTMLGFAGVVLVLVVGAAYLAWRDTFGDASSLPPAPPVVHGFEA